MHTIGLAGRARVRLLEHESGLLVCETVHGNTETSYALNSVATWLVGGAGVIAPAAPSYLTLGLGPPNLLSAAQADFETSPTGWQAASNCTVPVSAAHAWYGVQSMAMTATSAASMTATTTPGTGAVPVTAGYQYSASAHFLAGSAGRQVGVNIAWYDSSGSLLSTTTGTTVADNTSTWVRASVTGAAPASAAYAAAQATVVSAGAGEVHYVDAVQLAYAPDGPYAWQEGGQSGTPAVTDTQLFQERHATRARADIGYTQDALAVLLHTYQQTDPSGMFAEAGLFDANVQTAQLNGAVSAGSTSVALRAGAPAVAAGTRIYFGDAGEYATVAAAAAAGASSWTLTDMLLAGHADGATVTAFTGNLWAHVQLVNVSKTGTQLLSLQWELQVAAS